MKMIVVTGGVISGIGKGITASSIGLLLDHLGIRVTTIKIDPYLNVDAGTMSPFEHGECYVLADGGEADLDLGNYERFLDVELTRDHNITTGKVYYSVISKERAGEYLGQTVQIVPHITNEIIAWIERVSHSNVGLGEPEVCVIEVGGTIGDMETAPFIEAIRQMSCEEKHQFCFVHVSMTIDNGALKTKPTQHSVAKLRSYGIFPHFLVMRTPKPLPPDVLQKLKVFCHIPEAHILSNTDAPNIYFVPEIFKKQEFDRKICTLLDLEIQKDDSEEYRRILDHFTSTLPKLRIGIVGKYVGSQDTYLSLLRAIEHASFHVGVEVLIEWVDAETVPPEQIATCDGFIIPGGFGSRGIEGMMEVATYARVHTIPLLGICLGLQVMVTEYFRWKGFHASSTEWDENTEHPVIAILPDQTGKKGGTMRLGNYKTTLDPKSRTASLYGTTHIVERHRHRYEVNNNYLSQMKELRVVGTSPGKTAEHGPTETLVEVVELVDHPLYIGTQFHPEFRSRYNKPHPLFVGLLQTIKKESESV